MAMTLSLGLMSAPAWAATLVLRFANGYSVSDGTPPQPDSRSGVAWVVQEAGLGIAFNNHFDVALEPTIQFTWVRKIPFHLNLMATGHLFFRETTPVRPYLRVGGGYGETGFVYDEESWQDTGPWHVIGALGVEGRMGRHASWYFEVRGSLDIPDSDQVAHTAGVRLGVEFHLPEYDEVPP